MIFSFPKQLKSAKNVEDFLLVSQKAFTLDKKLLPNVIMDCSRIKDISIIGVLLIYKFIDYTYLKFCFKNPSLNGSDFLIKSWINMVSKN